MSVESDRPNLKQEAERMRLMNGIVGIPFMIAVGLAAYGYYSEGDLEPPLEFLGNETVIWSLFASWGFFFAWVIYREVSFLKRFSELEREAGSETLGSAHSAPENLTNDAGPGVTSANMQGSISNQGASVVSAQDAGGIVGSAEPPKSRFWLVVWGVGMLLTHYWVKVSLDNDAEMTGTMFVLIIILPVLFFNAYFRHRGKRGFWGGLFGLLVSFPMLFLSIIILPPY